MPRAAASSSGSGRLLRAAGDSDRARASYELADVSRRARRALPTRWRGWPCCFGVPRAVRRGGRGVAGRAGSSAARRAARRRSSAARPKRSRFITSTARAISPRRSATRSRCAETPPADRGSEVDRTGWDRHRSRSWQTEGRPRPPQSELGRGRLTRPPAQRERTRLRASRRVFFALCVLAALLASVCALRPSADCAPKRLVNRSTRPSVSISFWRPVKNGWHSLQISRCSSGLVERVLNVFAARAPHFDFVVLGMNPGLHCELLGDRGKRLSIAQDSGAATNQDSDARPCGPCRMYLSYGTTYVRPTGARRAGSSSVVGQRLGRPTPPGSLRRVVDSPHARDHGRDVG